MARQLRDNDTTSSARPGAWRRSHGLASQRAAGARHYRDRAGVRRSTAHRHVRDLYQCHHGSRYTGDGATGPQPQANCPPRPPRVKSAWPGVRGSTGRTRRCGRTAGHGYGDRRLRFPPELLFSDSRPAKRSDEDWSLSNAGHCGAREPRESACPEPADADRAQVR
jgi:hypothetical protein